MEKENKKDRLGELLLTLFALTILTFISTPYEIYANNHEEFLFNISDFLPINIVMALSVFALLFVILFFLPKTAYKVGYGLVSGFTFMSFIQGLFLNGSINSLDGDGVGGPSQFAIDKLIINTVIWILVLAVFVVFKLLKKPSDENKRIVYVIAMIAILAVQVVSPVTVSISNPSIFDDVNNSSRFDEEKKKISLTDAGLTQIAKDNNVLVFIIDRFDEIFAERAYKHNEDIFKDLDGFTWYQDNISLYAHTFPAVPEMLSRVKFDPYSYHREDYLDSVYQGDTPLKYLSEERYNINLFIEQYYSFSSADKLPNYISNTARFKGIKTNNKFMLGLTMAGIGAYRTFPLAAKRLFSEITTGTANSFTDYVYDNVAAGSYKSDNDEVAKTVREGFTTSNEVKKQFSFVHIGGCHNLNIAENPQKKKCYNELKECFDILSSYINAYKKAGVYKNSTIIVTGDHGCPYDSLTGIEKYPFQTALFVKRSGIENGNLKISQTQVAHENMWASICESEGLNNQYGDSYFSLQEGINRERYIDYQSYSRPLTVWHYKVNGAGNDLKNYSLVSKDVLPGRFLND